MLMELNNAQRLNTIPDLSSILTTWRERLPNRWEDLPAWNDLVSWRNHMFSHVNNMVARCATVARQNQQQGVEVPDHNPHLGKEEIIWTVLRFAHIARRHSSAHASATVEMTSRKPPSLASSVASTMPSPSFFKRVCTLPRKLTHLKVGFIASSCAWRRSEAVPMTAP